MTLPIVARFVFTGFPLGNPCGLPNRTVAGSGSGTTLKPIHTTVLCGSISISVPLAVLQIGPGAAATNLTHGVALVTISNHNPTPSLAVGTGRGLYRQL